MNAVCGAVDDALRYRMKRNHDLNRDTMQSLQDMLLNIICYKALDQK